MKIPLTIAAVIILITLLGRKQIIESVAADLGAPVRIDGEVVFPDGEAVNWRELHMALNQDGPTEVLAKSIGGMRLLDISRAPRTWRAA